MGALISRWRKKQTTDEILEGLQKRIETLEQSKQTHIEKQRRLIGSLVLYSVLLYIVSAVIFCGRYLPEKWSERVLYSTPLAVFPVLVWLVRKFLRWYFVKRISKNESALEELKERKKEILEEVMEKETYKRAKEILEKYDPERFKTLDGPLASTPAQKTPNDLRQRPGSARPMGQTPGGPRMPGATPGPGATPAGIPGVNPNLRNPALQPPMMMTPGLQRNGMDHATPRPPPMPRPIPPRERSLGDRFVEYLLGDGPQNRYALVCAQCSSHNGMAMKEEFEFIQFRCCYCFHLNPARKKRPNAPKLETPVPRRANLGQPIKQVIESESDEPMETEPSSSSSQGQGQSQVRNRNPEVAEKTSDSEKSSSSESLNTKKDA